MTLPAPNFTLQLAEDAEDQWHDYLHRRQKPDKTARVEHGRLPGLIRRRSPGSTPGLATIETWTMGELEAGLKFLENWPPPPPKKQRRPSTVFMTGPLHNQMMAYQRNLLDDWQATVRSLAREAGDPLHNRGVGGHQTGDEKGKGILAAGVAAFLVSARPRYERAFETGQKTAVNFTGRSRVGASRSEDLVANRLQKNRLFVESSLFRDLSAAYTEAIRNRELSPEETEESIRDYGQSQLARVGMYATALWGVAHLAFASEMQADLRLMNWVVTSLNSCPDCPRIEDGNPYGPSNPLPTTPGSGDTQCLTNCLCLLEEA